MFSGKAQKLTHLTDLVGPSNYKSSNWKQTLTKLATERNLHVDRVHRETDPSDFMEGLYIKVEEQGSVTERYKWIRPEFLQVVVESGSHWLDRPIIPNQLHPTVNIYKQERT